MANVELRYLQYFVAVAEELNFGRAANRLQIAQPPLSRQIRRLERELGVELLRRSSRRVELTAAGQAFLEESRRILAQVEQAVLVAQRASRGEIGRLVVGFEGSFSYDVLPFSLKAYQEQFPDVELVVQEMTTIVQGQVLEARGIEIGFIVPPLDNPQLITETVWREHLVLVVSETNPLAVQPEVRLLDLANEPFVAGSYEHGCGLFVQVVQICRQAGFNPTIVQETNEIQMLLGFIAAGMGISLLPASVRHYQRPGVVYRTLQPPAPEIELAIVWQQNNSSPVLQRFINMVREFVRQNFRASNT